MKLLICGMFAFALSAGGSLAAEPVRPLVKAGITIADYEADDAQCRQFAKDMKLDGSHGMLPMDLARSQIYPACMKRAGYVPARLTAKEQRTYRSLIGNDLHLWREAFLQSPRAEEATRRLTPPLPRHPDGPAFTLAPNGAPAADGVQEAGKPVMTARVMAPILRLKTPFEYDGGKITVAAGEIFIPAFMALRESAIVNTWIPVVEPGWCAAATETKAKVQDKIICLFDDNDGYRVVVTGPNYELRAFALRDVKVLRSELVTTPLEFAEDRLEVEVHYDVRSRPLSPDLAVGVAVLNGRDYVLSRTAAEKDGVIDVDLGGVVARLTPSGNGKSRTYKVSQLDPQDGAAVLSEKERLAKPCSLNDFITEGLKSAGAERSSRDTLNFVLAADCVNYVKG